MKNVPNFDPRNPQLSKITITLQSDSRQAGQSHLAHKLAEFLAREGYSRVTLVSAMQPGHYEGTTPFTNDLPEACGVRVDVVDDVQNSNVKTRRYSVRSPS